MQPIEPKWNSGMCITKDKNGEKWWHRRRDKVPHLMLEQIRENSAKILSTRYEEWRKCEGDEDMNCATNRSNTDMEKCTMLTATAKNEKKTALRRRRKPQVQCTTKTKTKTKKLRCNQSSLLTQHSIIRRIFPSKLSGTLSHQKRTYTEIQNTKEYIRRHFDHTKMTKTYRFAVIHHLNFKVQKVFLACSELPRRSHAPPMQGTTN